MQTCRSSWTRCPCSCAWWCRESRSLIHLYSVAYMGGDRGYVRYFAYLNYFVFSMLLVLAANFVILIIGWAFVGAASYLLISYWYGAPPPWPPASRRS